ncbi:hypothetical protein R50073_10860 [Maricurvus nonylphenolicus]|uniref:hypothetical protein n=1 Tax=Maricurvus nonylphenolicus TaxID=1008307 RepID=UPI0036F1A8C3
MSATVIELNDIGIRASDQVRCLHESPGFALVQADGVVVGEFARNQARLNPLNTHYQYWQNLNTEPLHTDNPQVRHFGDLAYMHLQELSLQIKNKGDLVLAVPGSFSRDQLALLLGICQSLSLNVKAMVDSAVAAASAHHTPGHHLLIDLQLNQALVTELHIDHNIERRKTHIVPEQGWQSLLDHLAKYVSGEFIRQVRFDPKHTAAAEQLLYNQLPQWLRQAHSQKAIQLEVENQRIQLPKEDINNCVSQFFQPLLNNVQQLSQGGQTLYTDRWQPLPGVTQQLPQAQALATQDLAKNCLKHLPQLREQSKDNISFTTSLSSQVGSTSQQQPTSAANIASQPSHILWADHAYPLADTCYLRDHSTAPIGKQANGTSIAHIEKGRLSLQGETAILLNDRPVTAPVTLTVGDELTLPNVSQTLRLISVKEQL